MNSLDYWRLCDSLSIHQAACLIAGVDPSSDVGANCARWKKEEQPHGYYAALTAVQNALKDGGVKGTILREEAVNVELIPYEEGGRALDINRATVEVESLKLWLQNRGLRTGFFFPELESSVDYLDPKHPRYAKKLAMAVNAWLVVTDSGKTSPKKALDKWMRENAAQFDLTDADGKPIETAIEECSKVANWSTTGGAPKS